MSINGSGRRCGRFADIGQLKSNYMTPQPPRSGKTSAQYGTVVMQRSVSRDPTKRIMADACWAKEMETLVSILEEEPSNTAHLVEVTHCTKACIKVSFHSMSDTARRSLWSKFILLKVSTTLNLQFDKVYSKNTKQADMPFAHLQTLMLDAVGPIAEVLEMINFVGKEEQVELDYALQCLSD